MIIDASSFKWIEKHPEQDSALQNRYDNDQQVKELADKIHSSRMMAGPACIQCIGMAVSQLDSKLTTDNL